MISAALLDLVRCPECHSRLTRNGPDVRCTGCRRSYRAVDDAYLDLRPPVEYAEQTKYRDQALHADARHERVAPPLLGSKIRNDMLRAFLAPSPADRVIDLGCGSGRALLWNADSGATLAGIDISPFFAAEARQRADLLLGDLRRLPFADATFTKAYSLDVLEHLSAEALAGMLREASRILAPGGALFVYSHVRRNAPIAAGLRWINALARQLERAGLIDMRQERLRKSDHLNPLRDIPHLESVAGEAGFRIGRIRYYTPIVGGLVENIGMRMAERAMAKRAARRLASRLPAAEADAESIKAARAAAKQQIASSPLTRAVLRGLSAAMKIDLLAFGHVRSGPFFALLVKNRDDRDTATSGATATEPRAPSP